MQPDLKSSALDTGERLTRGQGSPGGGWRQLHGPHVPSHLHNSCKFGRALTSGLMFGSRVPSHSRLPAGHRHGGKEGSIHVRWKQNVPQPKAAQRPQDENEQQCPDAGRRACAWQGGGMQPSELRRTDDRAHPTGARVHSPPPGSPGASGTLLPHAVPQQDLYWRTGHGTTRPCWTPLQDAKTAAHASWETLHRPLPAAPARTLLLLQPRSHPWWRGKRLLPG